MSTYFLFESALGYGLFEIVGYEEISQNVIIKYLTYIQTQEFAASISDFKKASQIIKKVNFLLFKASEEALENAKQVNNNVVTEELKQFLHENYPSKKKNAHFATVEKNFSMKINEFLKTNIVVGDFLIEIS